jgi:hypothetical protein
MLTVHYLLHGLIQDVAIPKFTSQLISHGIDFTINRSDNIIKTLR